MMPMMAPLSGSRSFLPYNGTAACVIFSAIALAISALEVIVLVSSQNKTAKDAPASSAACVYRYHEPLYRAFSAENAQRPWARQHTPAQQADVQQAQFMVSSVLFMRFLLLRKSYITLYCPVPRKVHCHLSQKPYHTGGNFAYSRRHPVPPCRWLSVLTKI